MSEHMKWAVSINGAAKAKQDWSASCDDVSSSEFVQVVDKKGNAIALVVDTGWASGIPSNVEKHAKIIAAAPDLLAALKEILSEADPNSRIGTKARAAIAKAEAQ